MALRTWITDAELTLRLGTRKLVRLFDEDNDGTADTAALLQLREQATSRVAGYLRPVYTLSAVDTAVTAGTVGEVVRNTLDVAEWMAFQRYPEVARHQDWLTLKDSSDKDLMNLRKQIVRLDIEGTPEPAASNGGEWGQGDPAEFDATDPPDTFNVNGFADY